MYGPTTSQATDAQKNCFTKYTDACTEVYPCPAGQVMDFSRVCGPPPPPPPPPPCAACKAELTKCVATAFASAVASCPNLSPSCPPPPPDCYDGCQDALYCTYDKCGPAAAAAMYRADDMNSFEKMGCKDPANFRSWGLVFGIGCGVVGVLAVGAIVYVVFVKKKAKEGGLRT